MATDFGRPNGGNYFLGDFSGAPLVLPNGDFAIQFWSRLDSNAGNLFQYLFANATGSSAAGATLIYTVEAGQGSAALINKWHAAFRNDSGVLQYQDSNAMAELSAVGDGIEKLVVFQRRAGRLAFHICHKGGVPYTSGGNPSSVGTFTIQKVWIGVRGDNDAQRRFKENAGQFAVLSRSLSDAEIQALAVGDIDVRAVAAPADIMAYWEMETSAATALDLSGNGRHLTRFGSPATADFKFVTAAAAQPVQPSAVALETAVSTTLARQRHVVRPASIALHTGVAGAVAVHRHAVAPASVSLSAAISEPAATRRHQVAPGAVALGVSVSSTRAGGGAGVQPDPVALAVTVTSPTVSGRASVRPSDIALKTTVAGRHAGSLPVSQRHTVDLAGLRCGVSVSSPGVAIRSAAQPVPVQMATTVTGARAAQIHRVVLAFISLGTAITSHVPYTPAMSRAAHAMAGRTGAAPAARSARAVRF